MSAFLGTLRAFKVVILGLVHAALTRCKQFSSIVAHFYHPTSSRFNIKLAGVEDKGKHCFMRCLCCDRPGHCCSADERLYTNHSCVWVLTGSAHAHAAEQPAAEQRVRCEAGGLWPCAERCTAGSWWGPLAHSNGLCGHAVVPGARNPARLAQVHLRRRHVVGRCAHMLYPGCMYPHGIWL